MRQYELYTLPCESQNTENIILQWDITKEGGIRCKLHQSRLGSSCAWNLLIWGVIQQSVHEAKIHDVHNLQKRLLQTCFNFDENIIDAGMTIWDHVCMLVVDTLNTCSDMNVHLCDSPEHLWNCQCNLMHVTAILWLTLKAEVVFTCIFGFSTFTR